MSFDPAYLLISLLPSGIGFALFMYGKKEQRMPQLFGGLLLMVYPYFTDDALTLLLVGAAIGGALWLALRSGW